MRRVGLGDLEVRIFPNGLKSCFYEEENRILNAPTWIIKILLEYMLVVLFFLFVCLRERFEPMCSIESNLSNSQPIVWSIQINQPYSNDWNICCHQDNGPLKTLFSYNPYTYIIHVTIWKSHHFLRLHWALLLSINCYCRIVAYECNSLETEWN